MTSEAYELLGTHGNRVLALESRSFGEGLRAVLERLHGRGQAIAGRETLVVAHVEEGRVAAVTDAVSALGVASCLTWTPGSALPKESANPATVVVVTLPASPDDGPRQGPVTDAAETWSALRQAPSAGPTLAVAVLPRAGGELFLASADRWTLEAVARAVVGSPTSEAGPRGPEHPATAPLPTLGDITLEGLPGEASRRPHPAMAASPDDEERGAFLLTPSACTGCGLCARVCPGDAVTMAADLPVIEGDRCIECYRCVEQCPEGCLHPRVDVEAMSPSLGDLEGFLRLLAKPLPERRAATPEPTYLAPREAPPTDSRTAAPALGRAKPFYVLGLSIATMQSNGAALLKDGAIIGAVEEERFVRRKHHGWEARGRPGLTICNDLSVSLERAFAWRSVEWLCREAGVTLDDIDIIAVNGIPARYRRSYSLKDRGRPPRLLRSDRLVFVPHHLAHAASAFYVSGFPACPVFTVDGRGDRETAAFFRASPDGLEQLFDVLSFDDQSLGGVYETITRILGFGPHGQGSTMALASFGRERFDLSDCLAVEAHDRYVLHEMVAQERFARFSRSREAPITDEHRDLATSAQRALADACLRLVEEGLGGKRPTHLCMAGGVALNCQMNTEIRLRFGPQEVFIQPGAHDGGTALGAALEAHRFVTGEAPGCGVMQSAALGPRYDNDEVEAALTLFGVPYTRPDDICRHVAELVADGKVVCWHQGGTEYGPRALGSRSIVADPRSPTIGDRLNVMKGREPWRPFGPSVLAGHEADWFEDAFPSPFMLFTFEVKEGQRQRVPAILHVDQTTRPQIVTREAHQRYYDLIDHFRRLTDIPMVVNTSFNTHYEPICCTPADSIASFQLLGADYLAIEDFLVPAPAERRRS